MLWFERAIVHYTQQRISRPMVPFQFMDELLASLKKSNPALFMNARAL